MLSAQAYQAYQAEGQIALEAEAGALRAALVHTGHALENIWAIAASAPASAIEEIAEPAIAAAKSAIASSAGAGVSAELEAARALREESRATFTPRPCDCEHPSLGAEGDTCPMCERECGPSPASVAYDAARAKRGGT